MDRPFPIIEGTTGPPLSRHPLCAATAIALLSLAPRAGLIAAQETGIEESAAWDGPEALKLAARARRAREDLVASVDLQTYEARIEGRVYFFIDPEQGERYLIRVDQIATEVHWMAPNVVRQRLVGERSETRLPVQEFDYYLDRLTLVPHGFADEIQIGSGLDVRGVPHPFAQDAHIGGPEGAPYEFRLGESLSLSVPGRTEPIRIQEVGIRPRNQDLPGILGTIHVDLLSGSIVRMAFTFTPASYVDPRNERISVELDYGLWEGRHWLPNEQRIEVRREIPAVDIGVGTVIRAVLQVRGYTFDTPPPESFRSAPAVTFAPLEERTSYPFSAELYDRMEEDGLSDLIVDPNVDVLRARAFELLETKLPTGLSPVRFHVPALSSIARYDRVEGLRIGMGGSLQPSAGLRIRASGGYSIAVAQPQLSLAMEQSLTPSWSMGVQARVREVGGLGLARGSAALLSTLAATIRGEDYLDPYWVSGGGLSLQYRATPSRALSFGMGIERHSRGSLQLASAPLDESRSFRPVRPVTEAEFFRLDMGFRQAISLTRGGRGVGTVDAMILHGQEGSGVGVRMEVEERWGRASRAQEVELLARTWSWFGDPFPQAHRLLGGRGTVPGFPYRQWAGLRATAASLTGSVDVWGPRIRIRSGVHAGWAGGGARAVEESWAVGPTHGLRASLSTGVGLAWDILRLEIARGLGRGGEWQLLFSFDRRWWARL